MQIVDKRKRVRLQKAELLEHGRSEGLFREGRRHFIPAAQGVAGQLDASVKLLAML